MVSSRSIGNVVPEIAPPPKGFCETPSGAAYSIILCLAKMAVPSLKRRKRLEQFLVNFCELMRHKRRYLGR